MAAQVATRKSVPTSSASSSSTKKKSPLPAALCTFVRAGPSKASRKPLLRAWKLHKDRPVSRQLCEFFTVGAATGLGAARIDAFAAQLGVHFDATRPVLAASSEGWVLFDRPCVHVPPGLEGRPVLYWREAWVDRHVRLGDPAGVQSPLPLPLLQIARLFSEADQHALTHPPQALPAEDVPHVVSESVEHIAHTLLTEPRLLPDELANMPPDTDSASERRQAFWTLDHTADGSALLVRPPQTTPKSLGKVEGLEGLDDFDDFDDFAYYIDTSAPFAWQPVSLVVGTRLLRMWSPREASAPVRTLIPCTAGRARAMRDRCAKLAPPAHTHAGLGRNAGRLLAFVMALERATAELDDFPVYADPHIRPLPSVDWGADGSLRPSLAPLSPANLPRGEASPRTTHAVRQFLLRVLLSSDAFWLDPEHATHTFDWCLTTSHVFFRVVTPATVAVTQNPRPTHGALPSWQCYDGTTGRVRPVAYVTGQFPTIGAPGNPERVLLTRRRLIGHASALLFQPSPPSTLRAVSLVTPEIRTYLTTLAGLLWPQTRIVEELGVPGAFDDFLGRAGRFASVPPAWWRTLATNRAAVPPAVQIAFLAILHEFVVIPQLDADAANWVVTWRDTPGGTHGTELRSPSPSPSAMEVDNDDNDGTDVPQYRHEVNGRCPSSLPAILRQPGIWTPWATRYLCMLYGRGALGPCLLRLDVRSPGSSTLVRLWSWSFWDSEWQPRALTDAEYRLQSERTLATVTVPQQHLVWRSSNA